MYVFLRVSVSMFLKTITEESDPEIQVLIKINSMINLEFPKLSGRLKYL